MEIALFNILQQLNQLNTEHHQMLHNLVIHQNNLRRSLKKRRKLIITLLKRHQHYRIQNTIDKVIDAYIDSDFHR